MLKRIHWLMEDPSRIIRAIKRRMPGVMTAGPRAVTKKVHYQGIDLFRKQYTKDGDGPDCFAREVLARRVFGDKPWIIPIREQGDHWISLPYLPESARLDIAAQTMPQDTRREVVRQSMLILLDIHTAGYFHGDFAADNLFWYQDQLIVGDFEKFTAYPPGKRPPFMKSFDICGDAMGIPMPGNPGAPVMFYSAAPEEKPLATVLNTPLDRAREILVDALKDELRSVCLDFQSLDDRHSIRARKIYSSFTLPYFAVLPNEAQRDCAKRIAKFGIGREELNGASLLDLGCNIGGMIFESQQFGPGRSVGVEFDKDKVEIAAKIAAYNGLNNVQFQQANVDNINAGDLDGPFDVVSCLALIMHVKRKDHLYRMLDEVTGKLLLFEGNRDTDQEEIRSNLRANGFSRIEYLGLCDDDCLPDNNCRPVFMAIK